VKSFKIYIRPFYIIFLITQLFSSAETKLKLLENNQLIGEVSTIQNKNLISINDFIEITNSKNFINDKTEKIIFYIDDIKIKLTNQIPFIMIDDNLYQLSSNVIKSNNNYYVPAESFFSIVNNLSNTISITLNTNEINFTKLTEISKKTIKVDLRSEKEKWEFKTIVIDAGHGGKDPGAVGYRGTKEKDIALDVAKRLEKKLAKNMKVKIVMTRDEDIFLRLSERTKIANESNGSLFISIHTNAAEDRRASGFETFLIGQNKNEAAVRVAARENAVLELEGSTGKKLTDEDLIKATIAQSAFASKSEQFASLVQKEIKKRVQSKDRGVKQAGFYVLMGASMPNVLVELGFISNPSEEKKLRSPQYRDQLATAIYRAVEQYQKTL
jgi:N-acetylmuramoyl-L-alanine amidase